MKKKKVILLDFSPTAYGSLFSATKIIKTDPVLKKQVKKDENGKWNLDQYRDIVIEKIITEIAHLRGKFDLKEDDEIVICTDTSTKEGYWRRDIWAGYKSKRKDDRDKSDIQWEKAFPLFQEVLDKLDECSKNKVIRTPRTEGDDIIFVLAPYLEEEGCEVIIFSSDHDMIQCVTENTKFWRTTRTKGMENSEFYQVTPEELVDVVEEHVIGGDPNDGFYHIKSYSRFSKDFLGFYPHLEGKELSAYPKRFQLEKAFRDKTGKEAYSHPRYGYKTYKRGKKSLQEILDENPIYQMNYELNEKLALPQNIPVGISKHIIRDYQKAKSNGDFGCLTKWFTDYGLIDLIGEVNQL